MKPNVLVLVSDQHRRDACGAYGSKVRRRDGSSPTPQIDRLAARGTAFDRAVCNSPLCAPSRASLLTGLQPHTTTALHHKMLEREAGLARFPGVRAGLRTIADHFRAAGYRTGAIGKMHVHGEEANGWDLGFDVRELRFYTQAPGMHYADLKNGDLIRRYRELPPYREMTYRAIDPRRYAGAPPDLEVAGNTMNQHRLETLVEREEEMFDRLVADRSIAFIDDCNSRQLPFLLHVGLEKPHEPWSVHRRFLDLFDPETIPLPATLDDWRDRGWYPGIPAWQHADNFREEIRAIIASYYACAAEMDHELGRVVEHCARLGVLGNTIVVYTSDHGELIFDHGLIYKHNFFAGSVDVPLIMAGPGIPEGSRCAAPACLVDLLPTLLDLAGCEPAPDTEGLSLRPAAHGSFDPQRPLFSEFHQAGSAAWEDRMHPTRMVCAGEWKFIYTHGARDQLFHTGSDPDEMHDLAADPEHKATLRRLRYLCLRDWELDTHPQLTITARRTGEGVALEWESAGEDAAYDIWREPLNGEPELLATDVPQTKLAIKEDSGCLRYRVVAWPALTRRFADPQGCARYGEAPVLAENYGDYLPVTALVELPGDATTAKADYRPWHSIRFDDKAWIYEGVPPVWQDGFLQTKGPCAILTPRFVRGDFELRLASLRIDYDRDAGPAESFLEMVFAWDNAAGTQAVRFTPDGWVRLVSRRPEEKVLAEARIDTLDQVTLRRRGSRLEVLSGQLSLLSRDLLAVAPGRVGLHLGLGVASLSVRMSLDG